MSPQSSTPGAHAQRSPQFATASIAANCPAAAFFAGNIIGLGGPTTDDFFPIARKVLGTAEANAIDDRWEQDVGAELLWCTPDEVRARVRRYIQAGTQDFLKYAASGHTPMQFIAFSEVGQRLIGEEAHQAGLTVQAHATSPESLKMAIDAGADLLQHPDITGAAPIPPDTLQRMVDQQLPCAAMFVTRRFLDWNAKHGQEPMQGFRQIQQGKDRALDAARARILLTTDGGVLPPTTADHPLLSSAVLAQDSPTVLGRRSFPLATSCRGTRHAADGCATSRHRQRRSRL